MCFAFVLFSRYRVPTEVLNPLICFDEVQVLETPAIHLVN